MVSLTKKEIFSCLGNVSREIENICLYHDIPMSRFLNRLDKVDLRVYMFISKLRYLSYYEDAFIDKLDNNDIDLTELRTKIFIDKKSINRFSNKQIIKYIRNAFSHSNGDKNLYKISVNGRFLEVYLKESKPCEFHIKISLEDFDELINKIRKNNFYLSIFENDCLKRYYLNSKLSKEELIELKDRLNNYSIMDENDYSRVIIDYYNSVGKSYEIKEYKVMPEQDDVINLYNSIIDKSNKYLTNDKRSQLLKKFNNYELSKIIPLQEEKLTLKDNNIFFIKLAYEYSNYSFDELVNEFINTGRNLLCKKDLNNIQNIIYKHMGNNIAGLSLFNDRDLIYDTVMEYISYYIMNINSKEKILIGKNYYPTQNIRNSFAHGRWFIDRNNNIILCDTKNGKNNDYNFYWKIKVKLIDFFKIVSGEEIVDNKVKILKY